MEKFIDSFDGIKIFYRIEKGKKNTYLIFLHGISGNCTVWNHQIDFFKGNYPSVAIDLCGHGKSHKQNHNKRYTITNFAMDIDSIIESEKIKNFVLIGHSLGGMVALEYDKLYPGKAKAFVLIATPAVNPLKYQIIPYLDKVTPIFVAGAKGLAWLTGKIKRKSYPYIDYSRLGSCNAFTVLFHDLRCTPADAYFSIAAEMFNFDIRFHLKNINKPVLLISGDMDMALSRKAVCDIKKIIGEKAKLVIMRRTDHLNPIRKPHELSKIINDFLMVI
ncbi:MAG: alpha/beta hydrolase [Candidatus Woesearchaeota archaeon]